MENGRSFGAHLWRQDRRGKRDRCHRVRGDIGARPSHLSDALVYAHRDRARRLGDLAPHKDAYAGARRILQDVGRAGIGEANLPRRLGAQDQE
jgi:hypothetical protein